MQGIIDTDTHISEGEAMWAMMDKNMYPRGRSCCRCRKTPPLATETHSG